MHLCIRMSLSWRLCMFLNRLSHFGFLPARPAPPQSTPPQTTIHPAAQPVPTPGHCAVPSCHSRQPIFSPRSAHAQPIFGTPQIEVKLTPRVGHHTSSPPLEAFRVTTNGLAYRGQQRSGGQILHSGFTVRRKVMKCSKETTNTIR